MNGLLWGLLVTILAAEFLAWAPTLARWLLKFNASRLPAPLAQRMAEEWEETAASIPGPVAKLVFALDLFRAVPRLRHDFRHRGRGSQPLGYRVTVRALNVVASGCLLLLLAPVLFLTAIMVTVTSGLGPFVSGDVPRALDGSLYRQFRFRVHCVGPDGPALTPFGGLLRKSGLETLPQLWNVARTDVTFIEYLRPPLWGSLTKNFDGQN